MKHIHILLSAVLTLGLLCPVPSAVLAALNKNSVGFYIEAYGRADPADAKIARTYKVFEKVRAAADKKLNRLPRLAIVRHSSDSGAVALPDDYIVLSSQTVKICYKGVSPQHGDARIAFILGHELAHLGNNDFWHKDFFNAIKNETGLRALLRDYRDEDGKEKEINADDQGFLYAAMAGFAVDKLLGEKAGKESFFHYWQQQTAASADDRYPTPAERAEVLRVRLKALLPKIKFFDFGVRLSHFEHCEDALYFFEEFLKIFRGREVYNNMGFCHLQLARKELGSEAYVYWMPLLLDTATRAGSLSLPVARTLRGAANARGPANIVDDYLMQAQSSLEIAVKLDPGYVPAWINLAVTGFYRGDIHIYEARAAVEKARQLAPDDLEIQALRALILYEEGREAETWPRAITLLEELAKNPDAPLSILYNTAQLLEKRRGSGGRMHWQKLARQATDLPKPIYDIVCQKHSGCPQHQQQTFLKTWNIPITPGIYIKRDKHARQTLKRWHKTPFDWGLEKMHGTIYEHPEGTAEVLELAGYAEMVVLKSLENKRVKDLSEYCGQALRKSTARNGSLWSCDNWAALADGDRVKEVWAEQAEQ
ncbi:MAG: hypothetical protein GY862_20285 [Gammaproteobacteria bacterium]|nr:hypothetical protein [Gammaproteobacteria bacterium]